MSSKNSSLIRHWFEQVWNQGKFEVIDQMSHSHARGHGQVEHGRQIDMSEFKQLWNMLRAAFPDLRFTIHDTIEEGDKVAARWTATMTHKGTFLGVAPTGRTATITGISLQRFEDGKIVEGWDNWDQLGLLVQIGAVPNLFSNSTKSSVET
jgi:steroid delta-isomerase-like uncharacterized protein